MHVQQVTDTDARSTYASMLVITSRYSPAVTTSSRWDDRSTVNPDLDWSTLSPFFPSSAADGVGKR